MKLTRENMNTDEVHNYVKSLIKLINHYRCLIDAYVSDAFVKNYLEQFPREWIRVLRSLDPPAFASLLQNDDEKSNHCSEVWPLSLLAFRAATQALSLPRKPVGVADIEPNVSHCVDGCARQHAGNGSLTGNSSEADNIKDGQLLSLDHCYRRHVKPKKQHEIKKLGEVVNWLSRKQESDHVVDIGAGQGHLSRVLSFGYGLNVTTVEAAGCHIPKAKKFDSEVIRDMEKAKKRMKADCVDGIPSEPNHIATWIEPDISPEEFLKVVKESEVHNNNDNKINMNGVCAAGLSENGCKDDDGLSTNHEMIDSNDAGFCQTGSSESRSEKNQSESNIDSVGNCDKTKDNQFIMTGLHACGDLIPTMLRVFCRCPQIKGLATVACCYMKLTDEESTAPSANVGYPMSKFVHSMPGHQLSYTAREMACHFLDAYHQRLKDNPPELIMHSYRAALQEVILDIDPTINHAAIKLTIKRAHQMTFEKYASLALQKLSLDHTITQAQLERAAKRISCWKDVVIIYTLRLMLAPVVESLILLDRMIFLSEQGIRSQLVPIFDPKLSPRNSVLIAYKDNLKQS